MVAVSPWRVLYRCDDLMQARAVATAIAAMEFDVQLNAVGFDGRGSDHEPDDSFPGPYVVEVPVEEWAELSAVIDEIIAEQMEFDAWIETRRSRQDSIARIAFISVTGAAAAVAGWWVVKTQLSG